MNSKFTNADIRGHLEELGYKNIPEKKLSTFVDDLRRLIKYEERKKQIDRKLENLENISPLEEKPRLNEHRRTRTKSKSTKCELKASSSYNSDSKTVSSITTTSNQTDVSRSYSSASSVHHEDESSVYVDVRIPRTKSTSSLPMEVSLLEPRSGVIRCRSTQPLNKLKGGRGRNDPVNLHQEYKKVWDKLNLPGETSHSKLRWAVRGWMMGEEPN